MAHQPMIRAVALARRVRVVVLMNMALLLVMCIVVVATRRTPEAAASAPQILAVSEVNAVDPHGHTAQSRGSPWVQGGKART